MSESVFGTALARVFGMLILLNSLVSTVHVRDCLRARYTVA